MERLLLHLYQQSNWLIFSLTHSFRDDKITFVVTIVRLLKCVFKKEDEKDQEV